LVLSPTSSINLGFTTEGRLAVVLIITFSWGFQLGGYIYKIPTSTSHHQRGNIETENTWNISEDYEDRRGYAPEVLPVAPSPHRHHLLHHHDEERLVHP
jgi:hypothetical protein